MACLADYMTIKVHACVGGTAVRDDIRALDGGTQVVVGTPGRIFDLAKKNALRLNQLKLFVLDEADEMLSTG